ncbi:hypothetical protein HCU64_08095 [Methylobacterium sp. C25]|uniref:hypothetical protein n=1 Tax=Methylobacterium sp. C25 TaxID=2721622 RepID=UPI001F42149C|nr:hypothetical protein [Methylobacterium sp. C25]MCE4223707.1 hypothetical protein [Methylobacterium sp. C25]
MIDIIQQLRGSNPSLPSTIIVLRADSRALADPETLTPEAQSWIESQTPGARLSQEKVLLAPYPGAPPAERKVTVLAFQDSRHLAAFATEWTGDPLAEGDG